MLTSCEVLADFAFITDFVRFDFDLLEQHFFIFRPPGPLLPASRLNLLQPDCSSLDSFEPTQEVKKK